MSLKVSHQLAMGLGLMCLLALLPSVEQIWRFGAANQLVTIISTDDFAAAERLRSLTSLEGRLHATRNTALAEVAVAAARNEKADISREHDAYFTGLAQATKLVEELRKIETTRIRDPVSPDRGAIWQQLGEQSTRMEETFRSARPLAEAYFHALDAGQVQAAAQQRTQLEAIGDAIDNQLDTSAELLGRLAELGRHEVEESYQATRQSLLVALVVVVVGSTLVTLVLRRSISTRLSQAVAYVRRIGEGDLRGGGVGIRGNDEFTALSRYLEEATGRLREATKGSMRAAESVHAATAQIRASTQQQAASVAEQLAAVEETTATLSEITESGAQISRRAQEVAHSAETISTTSATGLKAVDDTLQAMEAIREQSEAAAANIVRLSERTQAIGEIIITVNDIAERSHLLALNAAIEAAAAGEHGRTFAVVASEIKNLADQAKEATGQVRSNLSEIQHGINASVMLTEEAVKRVTAGKKQTESTQRVIGAMAETIRESVIAFQQIVAGTNQQQIGLEQVIQALQNIRQASTQTADGTRQLESAAGSLGTLGESLLETVRKYRV